MQSSDEDDIIARCRKGDVDAFEVMVKMYQGKMFNIAYRIIGDADDAAEVVQDAFVAAYRNLHAFEQRSRFSTWLYAITVNTSRNRMSQVMARKARETHSLDDPATPDTVKAGREQQTQEGHKKRVADHRDAQSSAAEPAEGRSRRSFLLFSRPLDPTMPS